MCSIKGWNTKNEKKNWEENHNIFLPIQIHNMPKFLVKLRAGILQPNYKNYYNLFIKIIWAYMNKRITSKSIKKN